MHQSQQQYEYVNQWWGSLYHNPTPRLLCIQYLTVDVRSRYIAEFDAAALLDENRKSDVANK